MSIARAKCLGSRPRPERAERTTHEPAGRASGAALLIVLWMLLILSMLATAFIATARSNLGVARNSIESARAASLADAGIARAVIGMADPDTTQRWRTDGTPYQWPFGGGNVTLRIVGENGKIDLNAATQDMLTSLFRFAGADDALARRLTDEALERRARAMTSTAPASEDDTRVDAYEPGFAAVGDLGALAGMGAPLLHTVEPLVTVDSHVATVDPSTAPAEVLLALPGASAAEVQDFVTARMARSPETPGMPALPAHLLSYLAAGALTAVTIRADAVTDSGARFTREALVLLRDQRGIPFVVKRWTQAFAPETAANR